MPGPRAATRKIISGHGYTWSERGTARLANGLQELGGCPGQLGAGQPPARGGQRAASRVWELLIAKQQAARGRAPELAATMANGKREQECRVTSGPGAWIAGLDRAGGWLSSLANACDDAISRSGAMPHWAGSIGATAKYQMQLGLSTSRRAQGQAGTGWHRQAGTGRQTIVATASRRARIAAGPGLSCSVRASDGERRASCVRNCGHWEN